MRPRVLDLYCGEGGAGMGYMLAGLDVLGVDVKPQPRYPGAFLRADVLDLNPRFLSYFHLIHASPPCQFGTALRHAPGAKGAAGHANLIPATRKLLQASGVDYVIENVEAVAPHLIDPVELSGDMFYLRCTTSTGQVFQLQRRRLFEANFHIPIPWSQYDLAIPVAGIYGGHLRNRAATAGGRKTRDFVGEDKPALARQLMGMPWATMAGMSEAIPPAYSQHIGDQWWRQKDMRVKAAWAS